MSNEVIFFTQIASIVVFIFALFGIYRSLVSQKDGVISLLREQLRQQENKIVELQSQSPDILAKTLSERIEISVKEIERLKKSSISRINKIAVEVSSEMIKQLVGISINMSNVSAIVEDISKKEIEKNL